MISLELSKNNINAKDVTEPFVNNVGTIKDKSYCQQQSRRYIEYVLTVAHSQIF